MNEAGASRLFSFAELGIGFFRTCTHQFLLLLEEMFFFTRNILLMRKHLYIFPIVFLAIGCGPQEATLSNAEVEAFVIEHITAQVGFEAAVEPYKSGLSEASKYYHPNMDAPSTVNLDNVSAEWFYEDSVTIDVLELHVNGSVASAMGVIHFHNFGFSSDRYFHGTVVKEGEGYRWDRWFHVDGGLLAKNGMEITSDVEGAEDLCNAMLYQSLQGNVDLASSLSDSLLVLDPEMALAGYGNMWKAWFNDDAAEWDRLAEEGLAKAEDESPVIAYFLQSLIGEPADRLKNAQMAHGLAPDSPITQVNLAWIMMAFDLNAEAKIILDQSINRWGNIGSGFNLLGYWHMGEGNMEKALDCFNMYVRLAPEVPNAYDSRGDYYVKVGDVESAKENFEKAISLSPTWNSSKPKLAALEEGA